ncbi:hypothetical protein JHK87_009826 [Glycine soja]|nr:hypothetical protein JHK87_009826 [Glycine soja]
MASENKVVGDDVVEISTTKKIWPQNIGSHFITLLEEEVKKEEWENGIWVLNSF